MPAPITNAQLYLAFGVPVLLNAVMFGLFAAYLNAKFKALYRRFDDMLDLWLKHLEEQHE
jgi:hypothetical protein